VPIDLFYPAAAAGANQPFAGDAGTRFPVIVFGHGFTISIDNYAYISSYLASRGYILALVDTETGFLPNHTNFGRDLAFIADKLQAEGANPGSPLFERIGDKTAVMGHSMGGGSSFLAVQYSANISAMVTMAAAETNPSAVDAADTIGIPSLVIAGGNDKVAPPATNQVLMYNALGSSCKYYMTTVNGSHCNFAPDSFTCGFGEGTVCIGCSFMDGGLQRSITMQATAAWLAYALGDCPDGLTALDAFLATEAGNGNVTSTSDCAP
jgi:predicted dienelactone hydrolase